MFYALCGIQIAAIAVMVIEFLYVFYNWSSKEQSYLLLAILFGIVNTLGYTLLMFAKNMDVSLYSCKMTYIGKTYVCLAIFLFTVNYCKLYIPKWVTTVLAVFQTFILVLVLTCEWHNLFYVNIEFVETGLFPHNMYTHGVFYYIFVVVQALYFVVSIAAALRKYVKTKNQKIKKQAKWFAVVLIIALIGPIIAVTGIVGNGYDLTTLSYCIDTILLFIIVMRYDLLKTVDEAKNYTIENIPSGILISDELDYIIYCNKLARNILDANGCKANDDSKVPKFFKGDNVFYSGKVYKSEEKVLNPSGSELVDIYLLYDITDSYNFQERLKEEVTRQTKNAEDRRKQVEKMSLQTVETLASAIDAKDPYTKGHSSRVAEYSVLLARKFGHDDKYLENLRYFGLLHDIGKISVPDSVLNKPSKLTDAEFAVIKSHTTVGAGILKQIESMPGIDIAAGYHHERYDGRGYPEGLSGENIPEIARIISIADSYDAMNSRRVYRNSLPKEKIREELVRGRGTQFDPDMLDAFLVLFDGGELEAIEKIGMEDENKDAPVNIMQSAVEDISEEEAQSLDSLTGLLMRKNGEEAIMKEMMVYPGALAFIDVDNLKVVNESMGHLAGDHLIQTVGKVLKEYEDMGIISRHGGDEFLFFIRNARKADAGKILNKLVEDFEAVAGDDQIVQQSSLSIGVCISKIAEEYKSAYVKADKALYYVKTNGKHGIHMYDMDGDETQDNKSDVDLEKLMQSLKSSGGYDGAMDVENQALAKLYEYTGNIGERYGHNYKLVMVTLDVEGELEIDGIESAMECMGEAIRNGIRNVDISTRYSSVQYLIILMNAGQSEISMITDRIFKGFYKRFHGHGIQAHFNVAGNGAEK